MPGFDKAKLQAMSKPELIEFFRTKGFQEFGVRAKVFQQAQERQQRTQHNIASMRQHLDSHKVRKTQADDKHSKYQQTIAQLNSDIAMKQGAINDFQMKTEVQSGEAISAKAKFIKLREHITEKQV